jgi:hypothetical protein
VEGLDIAPGALLTMDGTQVAVERQLELGKVRAKFTRSKGASGSGAVATISVKALRQGLAVFNVDSMMVTTPSGTRTLTLVVPGRVIVTP